MHSPLRNTIPVETLLLAYRSGIFPMADSRVDEEIFWVEPRERAVIPLDGLKVSKSLRKVLRSDRFTVTIDRAFEQVIRACAAPRPGHPESWISERIVGSYCDLHHAGHAHSVECWTQIQGKELLVGGLYGVSFDQVFCGESMFSNANNASKVALCWLVAMLNLAGYRLLDCQFMTDHLASMGAVEMPQGDYLKRVAKADGKPKLDLHTAFQTFIRPSPYSAGASAGVASTGSASAGDAADDGETGASSPGKRIAQSLIQTS